MNSNVVRAVFRRDLGSWFGNPTGYVFIVLFVVLAAAALVFWPTFFQQNLANLDSLNTWYPVLLLLFVPAITMGMWATARTGRRNCSTSRWASARRARSSAWAWRRRCCTTPRC